MRTLVDIPEAELEALNALSERDQRSRAALIREAIADYLQKRQPSLHDAFGLWGEGKRDGLAWQEKLRAEW